MNKDPEEDLSLPLWLSLTFSDAARYWHECLGLSQPMRSGFWFISKTDRIFSSGFMLYNFTSTKQMKRFLGSLWDEPKPKTKAVLCLHAFCYLAYLCIVGKPRVSEDLGYSLTANTSTASLGLFTDSSCLWSICWKKYEISTLVSCMWYVKLWIKVPKLCISHWCVNFG